MFTGIIKAIGRVELNGGRRLRVKADLKAISVGASVAVNGACLTVVHRRGRIFEFDLSPETMRLTTLGKLLAGDAVNLETSLRAGDKIDGHLVTGHIDGTGKVLQTERIEDGCVRLRVELPKVLRGYFARKGSVAIDGISLTVTQSKPRWFETVLIPYTLEATNLGARKRGDLVNLEIDPIARYLKDLLTRADSR